MNESDAQAIVASLAAAFPQATIGQMTMDVYVQDMLDLDLTRTVEVVKSLRRTALWFPRIAEIRRAYALSMIGAPQVEGAYAQALGPKEDRHPLVQAARTACGDQTDWRETPQGVMRRRFADTYEEKLQAAVLAIAAPGGENIGLLPGTPPIAGELEA